jgi:hypothetical protein
MSLDDLQASHIIWSAITYVHEQRSNYATDKTKTAANQKKDVASTRNSRGRMEPFFRY